jgi:hypothetical protein
MGHGRGVTESRCAGQSWRAQRRAGRRLLLASLSLMVVAALVPALAKAGFLAPVELSDPGHTAHLPQVAADDAGDAISVWYRDDGSNLRVQARTVSATGVLGTVKTLSPAGRNADTAQVATDANGDSIAVWRGTGIQARTISAAGALGALKTLSPAGGAADTPQVATDDAGKSIAVWERSDGTTYRIQARTVSATGALGTVKTLSLPGRNAFIPQVDVDADGDATVVWSSPDETDGGLSHIQAQTISSAGVPGALQELSAAGQNAFSPQVATDDAGDAIMVWRRFDGASYRIQARTMSPGHAPGAIKTLSAAGQDADSPEVATDANGDAITVWQSFDGADYRIQARRISAAGALGPIKELSGASLHALNPDIASDDVGAAVGVWERFDGRFDPNTYRIQARTVSAAGALGAVQDISPAELDSGNPQVATGATGNAIAVWGRTGPYNTLIQASRGP